MEDGCTLALGRKRSKKFIGHYGEHLVCVRYRYDKQQRKRLATVEIIVEESGWSPPEKPEIVGLRVEFHETELQGRVKQAGDRWNSAKRVWVSLMIRRLRVVSRNELSVSLRENKTQ